MPATKIVKTTQPPQRHYCYYYDYLLNAYCPVNCTRSPQGFHKLNLKQVTYKHLDYLEYMQSKICTLYKHKTYKHNPKVHPFGIALIKNGI